MLGPPPVRVLLSGAAAGSYLVSGDDPLTIGRAGRVRVYDLSASRHHCRVELGETGLWVSDLGSTNGTFVNGRPIDRSPLDDGDQLRLGHADIRVRVHPDRPDPLLQREFACRACGRPISLETFADGEVMELAGTFLCPRCALRREMERSDLDESAIRERLLSAGFRDLEPLSGPGSALLFTARRTPLNQPVILKVLETAGLGQPRITRFIREARIAARLNHPNIVHLHDVGRTEGLLYMVLERLEGCTLLEDIETRGAHPPQRVLGVALPVARALAYAHREGVLHRDLKPANIMIGPDGMVKLIDFGIARMRRRHRRARPAPKVPEGPLGTLSYAAPEQLVDAAQADELSDIFAFGSTLYHALTGRPPFVRAGDAPGVRSPAPPSLRQLGLELPSAVIELVERCMEPNPKARIPDASALIAEVERAIRAVSGFQEAGRHPELLVRYDGARATAEDTRRIAHRLRGTESPGGPVFFGRFRGDELVELAQLVELNQKTGHLEVEEERGEKGNVWFAGGRAVRARFAGEKGREALLEIFSLGSGWFHLRVEEVEEPAEHDLPLSPILLEVMRRRDEQAG